MIGTVLQVLDRMDSQLFEQVCAKTASGKADEVRKKANTLNPPEDPVAVAAAKLATEKALSKCIANEDLSIFSVAVGHDLGSGSFSRVRYAKLIVPGLPQSQWPEAAVKIMDKDILKSQR